MQINFRKADKVEDVALDVALQRTPMDHGCECSRRDVILLPIGRGELTWLCPACPKIWRIVFNEKGGDIYAHI